MEKTRFQLPQTLDFLFLMIISFVCWFSVGNHMLQRCLRCMHSYTGTDPRKHSYNSCLFHLGKSGSPLLFGCWTPGSSCTRVASGLLQKNTCVPPGKKIHLLIQNSATPEWSFFLCFLGGLGVGLGLVSLFYVLSSSFPHTLINIILITCLFSSETFWCPLTLIPFSSII